MSQEVIEDFITTVYTPQLVALMKQAFSLFEAFEHQNAYSGMMDIINNESLSDIHSRGDEFSRELIKQLDYVLNQHLVYVLSDSNIRDRVEICDALYRIQHLEDYTAIDGILYTDDDAIDKMSLILQEMTTRDQGHFLAILKEVDDRAISLLRVFVDTKLQDKEPAGQTNEPVRIRTKILIEAIGVNCLAAIMVEAGMALGEDVKLYVPFVEDSLVVADNFRQTAANFLSILSISNVPDTEFINVFREISEQFFKNPADAIKVESELTYLIARTAEYRIAYDEKTRILKNGSV